MILAGQQDGPERVGRGVPISVTDVAGLIRASTPTPPGRGERIHRRVVKREADRESSYGQALLFVLRDLYIMLRLLMVDSNKNRGLEA